MKDKIINLLGQGYSVGIVASAVGCEPSYVSQVAGENGGLISEERLRNLEQSATLDKKSVDLEEAALERLGVLIPFITRASEAAGVYSVLNKATKRSSPNMITADTKAPIVQLTLPAHMAVTLQLSSDRQVVEVNGRSLNTLPAAQLVKRLEERTDASRAIVRLESLGRPTRQSIANVL